MTIIAYKNGLIAADTTIFAGDIREGSTSKIARNKTGDLVGASGVANWCRDVLQWFVNGEKGKRPHLPMRSDGAFDASAGIIRKSRPNQILIVESDVSRSIYPMDIDPALGWASGAGWHIALGAMHAGASPIEAVKAAIRISAKCGGDIHVMRPTGRPMILLAAKGFQP